MANSDLEQVRRQYDAAIVETYRFYEDLEDMAAYLMLERNRLQTELKDGDTLDSEEKVHLEETSKRLADTAQRMNDLLDRIELLLHEKRQATADVLASRQILKISDHLGDFLDWSEDLSADIRSRVDALKSEARISSEISDIRIDNRKS